MRGVRCDVFYFGRCETEQNRLFKYVERIQMDRAFFFAM